VLVFEIKKIKIDIKATALGFLLLLFLLNCKETKSEEEQIIEAFREMQLSHIEGNVPEGEDFVNFLKRDLTVHMGNLFNKKCIVGFEFLRKGHTQSGVAYPKYYLWVTVKDSLEKNDVFLAKGAVRVAAVEKERFDITHFLSVDEIRKDPQGIYTIFPGPVCERIDSIVLKEQ
jgi:hypothetical protein